MKPKRGDASVFHSLKPDGKTTDVHSLHTACPVITGGWPHTAVHATRQSGWRQQCALLLGEVVQAPGYVEAWCAPGPFPAALHAQRPACLYCPPAPSHGQASSM